VVALARVTQDLDEPRGPDVACSIEVPEAWFLVGATLQIALPRLLSCARCDGGGCDACERRGAFEQQAAGIASEVAVVLPVPVDVIGAPGASKSSAESLFVKQVILSAAVVASLQKMVCAPTFESHTAPIATVLATHAGRAMLVDELWFPDDAKNKTPFARSVSIATPVSLDTARIG